MSQSSGIHHVFFDAMKIERDLLASREGITLAERFFPTSFLYWKRNNPSPVKRFSDSKGLRCANCGADLLSKDKQMAIVVHWEDFDISSEIDENYIAYRRDIYWCCKGDCDRILKARYLQKYPNSSDSWSDISDLCLPHGYLSVVLSTIQALHKGEEKYADRAMEKLQSLLMELYPFVTRELTDDEEEQLQNLRELPSYLGGLGE